jgi:hypothetical protein
MSAAAGQAAHNQEIRETTATIRFMVAPVFSEPGGALKRRVLPGLLPVGALGDDKNIEVTHTDQHPPPACAPARDLTVHQQPDRGPRVVELAAAD